MEAIFEHRDGHRIYQPSREQLRRWIESYVLQTLRHIQRGHNNQAAATAGMIFQYERELEYRRLIDAGLVHEQPYD